MRTSSAKTMKNFQSDRGESSTSTSLDENLWGTLQHHVDLAENVYSRLPFEEFFQLRAVCTDWYVVACKRLGLKEPIHKPFFTLFTKGHGGRLHGILLYNALSWSWTPSPAWHSPSFTSIASEGVVYLLCDSGIHNNPALLESGIMFCWQSHTYALLEQPPPTSTHPEKIVLGICVSESESVPLRWYSSFRINVVRGRSDFDTQVYKSGPWHTVKVTHPQMKSKTGGPLFHTQVDEPGMWQTKPCRVPKPKTGGPQRSTTGCADCHGRVYITTEHSREILVYHFEKARWSTLLSPCDWISNHPAHYCLDTLGAWNGGLFDVTCDFQSPENWSLLVWELVDETQHEWRVYSCMPNVLCSWLRSTGGFLPLQPQAKHISLQAGFCGDFLLVYSWDFENGWAGRFSLFNMVTKNWQELNIAAGTDRQQLDCYRSLPWEHLSYLVDCRFVRQQKWN